MCRHAVVARSHGEKMPEGTRRQIVLLGDQHGRVFVHDLPDIPLEHDRIRAQIVCMEHLLRTHRRHDDPLGPPRRDRPQLPEEPFDVRVLHTGAIISQIPR